MYSQKIKRCTAALLIAALVSWSASPARAGYTAGGTGSHVQANDENSIAIGGFPNVDSDNTIAEGTYSVAIGSGAQALEYHSTAIGGYAKATAVEAVALGYTSSASANYSIALGSLASAGYDYSVAVGFKSNTTEAYEFSIGSGSGLTKIKRFISNVQSKPIAQNGSYAATTGQMYTLGKNVSNKLGVSSDSSGNPNGKFEVGDGGEQVNTVQEAINKLAEMGSGLAVEYDDDTKSAVTLNKDNGGAAVKLTGLVNSAP